MESLPTLPNVNVEVISAADPLQGLVSLVDTLDLSDISSEGVATYWVLVKKKSRKRKSGLPGGN